MNNTISINISIDDILKRIYATSALRYFKDSQSAQPTASLLTQDQRPALRLQVIDSFAHTILHLLPHIESTNLKELSLQNTYNTTETESDIITVNFRIPDGFDNSAAHILLDSLEHAISMDALSLCYVDTNEALSQRHAALALESVNCISRLFAGNCDVSISPSWL